MPKNESNTFLINQKATDSPVTSELERILVNMWRKFNWCETRRSFFKSKERFSRWQRSSTPGIGPEASLVDRRLSGSLRDARPPQTRRGPGTLLFHSYFPLNIPCFIELFLLFLWNCLKLGFYLQCSPFYLIGFLEIFPPVLPIPRCFSLQITVYLVFPFVYFFKPRLLTSFLQLLPTMFTWTPALRFSLLIFTYGCFNERVNPYFSRRDRKSVV